VEDESGLALLDEILELLNIDETDEFESVMELISSDVKSSTINMLSDEFDDIALLLITFFPQALNAKTEKIIQNDRIHLNTYLNFIENESLLIIIIT